MPDPDIDLTQEIVDLANSPVEVEFDGQRVRKHSIKDMIAAQKFLNSNDAITQLSNGTAMFGGFRINAPGPRGGGGSFHQEVPDDYS